MTDCSGINADEQQLIKLCLKKPKKWHWELTTSKSSSNIAFPTIQLYDDDNTTLLTEANEANFIAGSKHISTTDVKSSKRSDSSKSISASVINSPITIVELPDETQMPLHDLKTSFSTADCKASSSSHHRRSSSSVRSRSSILKRIREFSEMTYEDESSDDENEDERETRNEIVSRYVDKKYSMRTCNIGTIIVPKESFSSSTMPRRRRRHTEEIGECHKFILS